MLVMPKAVVDTFLWCPTCADIAKFIKATKHPIMGRQKARGFLRSEPPDPHGPGEKASEPFRMIHHLHHDRRYHHHAFAYQLQRLHPARHESRRFKARYYSD